MEVQEQMAGVTNDELIASLLDLEDAVPRTIIDECVVRGEPMAQALITLIGDEYAVENDELHQSQWLRLHAIMILGLQTTDRAGRALVSALAAAAIKQDEFLMGWLAGYWPALFRNKAESCIADMPRLVDDPKADLYLRIAAAEVVLSFAQRQNAATLDRRLQWLASLAINEQESLEFRLFLAALLLNFPRHKHRTLIEHLAGKECVVGPMYSAQHVKSAYDEMRDMPIWDRFADPWAFYSPESIAERASRWSNE